MRLGWLGLPSLVMLIVGAGAFASSGMLAYTGCIANGGKHGCAQPTHNSLRGATDVVASPDGSSVYVVSLFGDSLSTFHRRPDGSLRYRHCVADEGESHCERLRHGSLYEPEALAISPDGRSVYVADLEGTLTAFHRTPDGKLRFQSCIGDRSYGCRELRHDPLADPKAIEVSADGRSVYVVSFDDSIAAFKQRSNGALAYNGCVADRFANPHCAPTRHTSLIGSYSLALSPDGKSAYVGSGDAVTTLRLSGDGSLNYAGCIANSDADGCRVAKHWLGMPWAIAASPDGKSVYAISLGDKVTSFARSSGGRLTYQRCIVDHRSQACDQAAVGSLLGIESITVAPGGESVFAGALTTVASFKRRADGSLKYQDCVANSGRDRPPACASIGNHSLQSVRGLAVSADDSSAYATSFDGDAIDAIAVDPPSAKAPTLSNQSGGR